MQWSAHRHGFFYLCLQFASWTTKLLNKLTPFLSPCLVMCGEMLLMIVLYNVYRLDMSTDAAEMVDVKLHNWAFFEVCNMKAWAQNDGEEGAAACTTLLTLNLGSLLGWVTREITMLSTAGIGSAGLKPPGCTQACSVSMASDLFSASMALMGAEVWTTCCRNTGAAWETIHSKIQQGLLCCSLGRRSILKLPM